MHVVCSKRDATEVRRFPQLTRQVLRHVHRSWPVRPRWLLPVTFVCAWGQCTVLNPRGTWRYLWRGWRRFGLSILRRFYVDASIVARNPSIVHFEFGSLAADRTHLRELLGCRLVVSFRGFDLNYVGLENPSFYETVWKEIDVLHLLGRDVWSRALNRGCPSDKPHALIPPAIDAVFFSPGKRVYEPSVGSEARPFRILSVGRLHWAKGYEYALQAVRGLIDRNVRCEYHIVGDGVYAGAVAFARHQLGLHATVELLGPRSPEEVKREYLWADAFLHPAVSEGFSNAVIEAQAMGLPVVCTDAGGLPENVANGETGYVVPRRDPDSLTEKLALLAHDVNLRRRMGIAGRERVMERFPIDRQLEAFAALYRRTVEA